MSGVYNLAFQSENVRSLNTNDFTLVNRIENITFVNQPFSQVEVDLFENEGVYSYKSAGNLSVDL